MVPKKGLEPPHPCGYMDLNHARLPIPPLRLVGCAGQPLGAMKRERPLYLKASCTSVKLRGRHWLVTRSHYPIPTYSIIKFRLNFSFLSPTLKAAFAVVVPQGRAGPCNRLRQFFENRAHRPHRRSVSRDISGFVDLHLGYSPHEWGNPGPARGNLPPARNENPFRDNHLWTEPQK
jgi:hypothetical protein